MPDVAFDLQDPYPGLPDTVRIAVLIRPVAISLESDPASVVPPPAPPPSPPTITNFSPPPGTSIFSTNPIQFDVIDPDGLTVVILHIKYLGSDNYEVVYDGGGFSPAFSNSTIQSILNGFHFVLRRNGGWPGSPYIYAIAVDSLGAGTGP